MQFANGNSQWAGIFTRNAHNDFQSQSLREITPIDSIVMSILSKNTSPLDVAMRIDSFLVDFRHTLETMPISEIQDHAASLSKQLRKPIQSLGDEVSVQVCLLSFSVHYSLSLSTQLIIILCFVAVLENPTLCSRDPF